MRSLSEKIGMYLRTKVHKRIESIETHNVSNGVVLTEDSSTHYPIHILSDELGEAIENKLYVACDYRITFI